MEERINEREKDRYIDIQRVKHTEREREREREVINSLAFPGHPALWNSASDKYELFAKFEERFNVIGISYLLISAE